MAEYKPTETVGLDNQSLFLSQPALAREIAAEAHDGQTTKQGGPYIAHPERVASKFDALKQPLLNAAAWLHDVIEDSEGRFTKEVLLARGVLPRVVELVGLLSRDPNAEDKDEYYHKINQDPDAREIKLADIADNTNPERLNTLDIRTQRRLLGRKYPHALELLGEPEWAAELRRRAEEIEET